MFFLCNFLDALGLFKSFFDFVKSNAKGILWLERELSPSHVTGFHSSAVKSTNASAERPIKEMQSGRLCIFTEAFATEASLGMTSWLWLSIEICCLPILQYCVTQWKQHTGEKCNFPYIFHWPFSLGEPTVSAWLGGYEGCLLVNDSSSSRMAPWVACINIKCQLCLCVCFPKQCDRLMFLSCMIMSALWNDTTERDLAKKFF